MPALELRRRFQQWRALSPTERRQQLGHYLHVAGAVIGRQDKSCPYCGYAPTEQWGKAALFMEVRRCPQCLLRFTWPKSGRLYNSIFYNWLYDEKGATDMPSPAELARLVASGFAGTPMDFSTRVRLVQSIVPQGRLLDFGASWGYGTYQFQQAGYEATGFEPSRARAAFGHKNLGVRIFSQLESLKSETAPFDVVFSSHVFEHLPNPGPALDAIAASLRPGGHLIAFVPNCDGHNARQLGMDWGPLYGSKHVLSLDHQFFGNALPRHGFDEPLFFSEPYDIARLAQSLKNGIGEHELAGDELLVVARRRQN